MSIIALKAFQDNYIWVIQQMSSFICIDPGDANPVLEYQQKSSLNLEAILVTHEHPDHVGGVPTLLKHFPEAVLYEPKQKMQYVSYKELHFDVLSTPGHTHNHICYFEPNHKWLFCGDTLFSAGCGRVFSGTMQELYTSLQTLKALPDETQVYCAHEYTRQNLKFALHVEPNNLHAQQRLEELEAHPEQISLPSTIGLEKEINPFFRCDTFEVFQAIRSAKDCF